MRLPLALAIVLLVAGCDRGTASATYEGKSRAEWQQLLADRDADTQAEAVVALNILSVEDPAAADALRSALPNLSGRVQPLALNALLSRQPERARGDMEKLVELLASPEVAARRQAVAIVATNSHNPLAKMALPRLEKLSVTDVDADVRAKAGKAAQMIRTASTRPSIAD